MMKNPDLTLGMGSNWDSKNLKPKPVNQMYLYKEQLPYSTGARFHIFPLKTTYFSMRHMSMSRKIIT